jgi:anthranilate phosphoribosyltransferase
MIGALRNERAIRAWVVHGSGFDEITTTGTTRVLALADGEIEEFTIDPATYGLSIVDRSALVGGEPEDNVDVVRRVLAGERGPQRDIVLLNAAGALVVGGRAADVGEGLELAAESIDDGAAAAALDALVAVSQRRPAG